MNGTVLTKSFETNFALDTAHRDRTHLGNECGLGLGNCLTRSARTTQFMIRVISSAVHVMNNILQSNSSNFETYFEL